LMDGIDLARRKNGAIERADQSGYETIHGAELPCGVRLPSMVKSIPGCSSRARDQP
jgi:hypothetical protein